MAISDNRDKQLEQLKSQLLAGLTSVGVPTPEQMRKTQADFRETAERAAESAEDSAAVATTIVQTSRSKIADLHLIDDTMQKELEAQLAANQAAIESKAAMQVKAAELAQGAMTTYRDTVTSATAVEQYKNQNIEVLTKQQELAAAEAESNDVTKSWWQRLGAAFTAGSKRGEVEQAQGELAKTQQLRLQSTQVFAQEVATANTMAGLLFQKDFAVNQAKVESSAAVIDNLVKQRANINDTVASLQAIHNLDSAATKSLRDKMEILNSQNINDVNAYASVFNAIESESRQRVADKQIKAISAQEGGEAVLDAGFKAFFAARKDIKSPISAAQWSALNETQRQALGYNNELLAFVASNAMTAVSPYTAAYFKTQAMVPLTVQEEAAKTLTESAVAEYNQRMTEEYKAAKLKSGVAKVTLDAELAQPSSNTSKELAGKLINLSKPEHFAKADAEGRRKLAALASDATPMYTNNLVDLASMEETLSMPEGEARFKQLGVPQDVIELIKTGAYKELETRVTSYEDFKRNEEAAVSFAMKNAITTDATGKQTFSMQLAEQQLQNFSKIMAANYRAQREFTQRAGFPLLSGTKISMPDASGKMGGLTNTDMENPGTIFVRLQLKLISKRAKRSATESLMSSSILSR